MTTHSDPSSGAQSAGKQNLRFKRYGALGAAWFQIRNMTFAAWHVHSPKISPHSPNASPFWSMIDASNLKGNRAIMQLDKSANQCVAVSRRGYVCDTRVS